MPLLMTMLAELRSQTNCLLRRQVPKGSGEQGQMEKTGWDIICGTPTTIAIKA